MKALKNILVLALMLWSSNLFAQRTAGVVLDKNTYLPVANAFVGTRSSKGISNLQGKFMLGSIKPGDTLRITCVGYKPYQIVIGFLKTDTLRCYIAPAPTVLNEVKVRAKRNAKADSLRNRREYASIFNYRGASVKDALITRSTKYVPANYINADKSTATILSVNVLSVIDALGKHKTPQSKLQKVLIKDEEIEYVDRFFSPEKVSALTSLKGDSLQNFMNQYHPDIKTVKKMNDYDMVAYIKDSYAQFVKTGSKQAKLPFK
ncbi:carboxypeptidase-like regulatory domain-containing protein [Mucilaginibacter celer]|uniref:Carboxypeptidase-like regulatory domain-containing protein n=1 Tax=Mucilaginibacter celer TaxID=2305508 RepID=A0A494VN51_9SPHI|nr:carboxypeptidase-like regulatory domain-containing protein [Mucilaginibacter celer]AYL96796.1 hypothetical protein HYN43_016465 [Mucilaginibacter celer]